MKTIVLACAAITLCCASITLTVTARADSPDPDVVCGMYQAGVPPAQIPDDVLRNNPRYNSPTLPFRVFQDLQDC
jgi:hypothetical protein